MKISVSWDVMQFGVVEIYISPTKLEALGSYDTTVNLYFSTWRHILSSSNVDDFTSYIHH